VRISQNNSAGKVMTMDWQSDIQFLADVSACCHNSGSEVYPPSYSRHSPAVKPGWSLGLPGFPFFFFLIKKRKIFVNKISFKKYKKIQIV
jgi:hypothetical protein